MYQLDKCDATFMIEAQRRFVNYVSTPLNPEVVFDVVSNILELEPEWFQDSVSMTWMSPPPHGVGSVREHKLKYMTVIEDFLIWEPGQRLVLRLLECSLPMLSTYLEDYRLKRRPDGGTDLTWEVCYRPRPVVAVLHPIIRPFFAHDFRKATRNLDALCTRLAAEQKNHA